MFTAHVNVILCYYSETVLLFAICFWNCTACIVTIKCCPLNNLNAPWRLVWAGFHLKNPLEPLKWRNIHDLYTTDTSLIRTLCSVPLVSVLERFDGIQVQVNWVKMTEKEMELFELARNLSYLNSSDWGSTVHTCR